MAGETGEQQSPPSFFQRLLQKQLSRREFMTKGIIITAGTVASAAGLKGFFELTDERDRARGEADASSKLAAEEKEKRKAIESALNGEHEKQKQGLTGATLDYLKEYEFYEQISNSVLAAPASQNSSFTELQLRKFPEEQKRFLLKRGVALLAAWDMLSGVSGESITHFDEKNARIISDNITFRINEDAFDRHIFFNIANSKLQLYVADNPLDQDLSREDVDDLLALVKLRPQIEIEDNSWTIMPNTWATTLARFFYFLDKHGIPPPQKTVIKRGTGAEFNISGASLYDMGGQILKLNPGGWGGVVAHEGGHYIADSGQITDRIIGLKHGTKFPNHQIEYERAIGMVQKAAIESLNSFNMINTFPTEYAATNQQEDFAEMFREYFTNGPVLRERIEGLKDKDPAGVKVLIAKYEYIKTQIAGREEFSFNGRKMRSGIRQWEQELLNIPGRRTSAEITTDKSYQKFLTEQLQRIPGFEEASIVPVIPNDRGHILSLFEPQVWADLLRANSKEIESVSAIHPVAHFEMKGKFSIPLSDGRSITFDPGNINSPDQVVEAIREAGSISKMLINFYDIEFSDASKEIFKRLAVSPPKVNLGSWISSYPPSFIDNQQFAYLRLAFDKNKGHWAAKPLDIYRTAVHRKASGQNQTKVFEMGHTPLMLDDKDIIFVFDLVGNRGNINKIMVNEGLKTADPSPALQK